MTANLMTRLEFFGEMLKAANNFTRSALAVAFVLLYRHINGRTGRCDPSTSTLAEETGLSARTVKSAVDELRNSGWWQITRGGGRGRTNSFLPHLEKVNSASPIGVEKGEVTFTLSPAKTVRRSVKKGEARFTRTSKNQNHTVDAHPSAARSACAHARECQTGGEDGANSEFDAFWQIYPSRRPHANPKKPARLKFAAAVKDGADPADIVRGAENYRAATEAIGTDARYVAQARTWLNEERWKDCQDTPEPPRLRVGMN
jgi:hypothetical protein